MSSRCISDLAKRPVSGIVFCYDCNIPRTTVKPAVYTCMKCGGTAYGFITGFIPNIWMYQKTRHSRRLWMENKLGDLLKYSDIVVIVDDFLEVAKCLINHNLIKCRNIAKYRYYILRLASHRKIELVSHIDDMKDGKVKDRFDKILFGLVYPKLGWDKGYVDSYHFKWLTTPQKVVKTRKKRIRRHYKWSFKV